MSLFNVNTGTREQEVCALRWDWEYEVPELETSVFVIPGKAVEPDWTGTKNKEDRLVVLNTIALEVIEKQRGIHPTYVFVYKNKRMDRMRNNGWKSAWKASGMPTDKDYRQGPHNLKHTCGSRLQAAGVSLETRKTLLGHKNGDITTHYSAPELLELIEAVELLTTKECGKVLSLTLQKKNN